MTHPELLIALGAYALMILVTMAAYALDKSRAVRGRHRVPERTLHLLELLGGWPGALVAQQVFRHKRRKVSFVLITCAIALMHLVAWGWVTRDRWMR